MVASRGRLHPTRRLRAGYARAPQRTRRLPLGRARTGPPLLFLPVPRRRRYHGRAVALRRVTPLWLFVIPPTADYANGRFLSDADASRSADRTAARVRDRLADRADRRRSGCASSCARNRATLLASERKRMRIDWSRRSARVKHLDDRRR